MQCRSVHFIIIFAKVGNKNYIMCGPGMIATVFSARNTLKVLSAAKFPRSMPIVR